jgi:hypothetical protein
VQERRQVIFGATVACNALVQKMISDATITLRHYVTWREKYLRNVSVLRRVHFPHVVDRANNSGTMSCTATGAVMLLNVSLTCAARLYGAIQ